jgi:hypothetical protein
MKGLTSLKRQTGKTFNTKNAIIFFIQNPFFNELGIVVKIKTRSKTSHGYKPNNNQEI